ncbi:hypothetical protein [Microbacterium maritypicum]|uniref:Uncharacterized protein n=1 Tax=Microbacterium maritypicum TaxID=33918 RepID=A0A4Y4B501_MICMQ|nr:hypothetical protein [Microbacterium liquefaciens]GEC74004.1 hypothetical protein MLI01_01490 [Microbacterium liquefaciens]GGV48632.1 hypothetical protein GCM10010213_01500 [Microbacterium liquefaciens]
MTDARLPGRWLTDPDFDALTDRLWRVHSSALMWSAEQGTDGMIPRRTLRLLHPEGAHPADADALVERGLWEAEGEGYRVSEWDRTQSLAADMERKRELDRDRKRRQRAKEPVTRDGMRDGTRESPRLGEERLGEARPGQAKRSGDSETVRTSARDSTPRREGPDERMRRLLATADAMEATAHSPAPAIDWPVREVPA